MQIKATLVRFVCLLFALSPLVLRAATPPAAIGVIYNNATGNRQMFTNEFAGAPGVRNTNWNNVNSGGSTKSFAAGTVTNSLGVLVPAMTIDIIGSTNPAAGFAGGTGSNDVKLLNNSGVDINQGPGFTANGGSAVVQGVPFANYTVFTYTRMDGGGGAAGGALNGIENPTANYVAISNLAGTLGQKVWISGGQIGAPRNFVNPDSNGVGYVEADTRVQPTDITQIAAGNYAAFTNLNFTDFVLYYGVVAGPSAIDGVAGEGNLAPRHKFSGFQIVNNSGAGVNGLTAIANVPLLYAGNPVPTGSGIVANRADGSTFPAHLLAGTTFTSGNTNIFTVNSLGNIFPGSRVGFTSLFVTNGAFSTSVLVTNTGPVLPAHLQLTATPTTALLGTNGIANKAQLVLAVTFAYTNSAGALATNTQPANFTPALWNFVSFVSSNTSVATVNNTMPRKGEVTPVAVPFLNTNAAVQFWVQFGTNGNVSATNALVVTNSNLAVPNGPPSFGVDIVSVDPRGPNTFPYANLSGAPGFRVPYWNLLKLDGGWQADNTLAITNTLATLHDRSGNALPGATVAVEAVSTAFPVGITAGANVNEDQIMETIFQVGQSAVVADTATQERTISITGIPYPLYDIYFLVRNDTTGTAPQSRVGHFKLTSTGETRYRRNSATLTGGGANRPNSTTGLGYIEAVPIGSTGQAPFFFPPFNIGQVPQGNMVRFAGLTGGTQQFKYGVDVSDSFEGGASGAADAVPALQLAAIQIVKSMANTLANNLYPQTNALSTTTNLLVGNPTATLAPFFLADFSDGTVGANTTTPFIQYASDNTGIFTVTTNGLMLSVSNGTANLIATYTNFATTTPISATQAITVLPASRLEFRLTRLADGVAMATNLAGSNLLAGVNVGQQAQIAMLADFAGPGGSTNTTVTTWNYVSFFSSNNAFATVLSPTGLVTAVSAGNLSYGGSLKSFSGGTNTAAFVVAYTPPTAGPESWAVNIVNIVTNNPPGTTLVDRFNDVTGIPGGYRMAYWNSMPVTNQSPFTAPQEVHGTLASVRDRSGNVLPGVTVDFNAYGNNTGAGLTGATSNEDRIISTFIDSGGAAAVATASMERTITVIGITNWPIYDVTFYIRNDTAAGSRFRTAHFTVAETGETRYRRNGATLAGSANDTIPNPANGGGYVEAVPLVGVAFSTNDVPSGNVVKFRGLTSSTLSVNWGADSESTIFDFPSGATRVQLAGFQISKNLATTLALSMTNAPGTVTTTNLLVGNPTATIPSGALVNYNDGSVGIPALAPEVQLSSQNTAIFTVTTNGQLLSVSAGTANLVYTFTNQATTTAIMATQSITVLPATRLYLGMNPTNMYIGAGGAVEKVQTTLFADFTNSVAALNVAGFTNVNLAAYNYRTYYPSNANTTITTNGLLTAVSVGPISYGVKLDAFLRATNAIGQVKTFTGAPTAGAVSFAFDVMNIATGTVLSTISDPFAQLSGIPDNRMAYWNPLYMMSDTNSGFGGTSVESYGSVAAGAVRLRSGASAGGTVSATMTAYGVQAGGGAGGNQANTNEDRIIATFLDQGIATNTAAMQRTITVNNVPFALYDVIFYLFNDSGNPTRVGHFTSVETGQTRFRRNAATLPGTTVNANAVPNSTDGVGYVEAVPIITFTGGNTPTSLGTNINAVPQGNYVKFANLTSATATFNWGADGTDTTPGADNANPRMRIAGFQVVKNQNSALASSINIAAPSASLALLPGNPIGTQLAIEASYTDGVFGYDVTAPNVQYSSANPAVFTVTTNGVMRGVAPGSALLTVSYTNLATTTPVTTTRTITVAQPNGGKLDVVSRVLTVSGPSAGSNTTSRLLANFDNGTNGVDVTAWTGVTFNAAASTHVSVGGSGNVTAIDPGLFNLGVNYVGFVMSSNNVGIVVTYSTNLATGSGTVISLEFKQNNDPNNYLSSPSGGGDPGDFAGAPGVRVTYWNVLAGAGSTNWTVAITNSLGGVVPLMSASVTLNGGGPFAANAALASTTNDSKLFGGSYLDKFPDPNPHIVVISNVPFATYDVYIYSRPGEDANTGANSGNRGGWFAITNAGYTDVRYFHSLRNPGNTAFILPDTNGVGYAEATTTVTPPTDYSQINGGNYVKFTGVVGDRLSMAFNTFAATFPTTGDPNGVTTDANPRLKLQGLQIVSPGTVLLNVRSSGTNVVLSWPYSGFGWILRSNNVVTGVRSNWANITPAAASLTFGATNISYTLPASAAQSYFILQQQ